MVAKLTSYRLNLVWRPRILMRLPFSIISSSTTLKNKDSSMSNS